MPRGTRRSRADRETNIDEKREKNQGNREKWVACWIVKRYLSLRKISARRSMANEGDG